MLKEKKVIVSIPFDLLPEGRHWMLGKTYKVQVVLKQVGMSENKAEFEIVDATSLESEDKYRRHYITDGGYLKG